MRLHLILAAAISMTATVVVLFPSLNSNVNAIIVNNTDFSVNAPDNWAYRDSNNPIGSIFGSNNLLAKIFGGETKIELIPNEFTHMLLNASLQLSSGEAIQNGGAYSNF